MVICHRGNPFSVFCGIGFILATSICFRCLRGYVLILISTNPISLVLNHPHSSHEYGYSWTHIFMNTFIRFHLIHGYFRVLIPCPFILMISVIIHPVIIHVFGHYSASLSHYSVFIHWYSWTPASHDRTPRSCSVVFVLPEDNPLRHTAAPFDAIPVRDRL